MPPKKTEDVAEGIPKGHARNWTAEDRRRAFNAKRKVASKDYQVIESDFKENLIPYNHITFDKVLGLKGIAHHGTVLQVHGDEGAGKTTTAISLAANYQKATQEPIAVFAFEPTTTPEYLTKCGVDMDYCFLMYPNSVQDAIKEHVRLMDESGVRLFLNDSIPFMDTKVEKKDIYNGKFAKANYGGNAKAMGLFYKTLRPYTQEYDATLFMVNQTRDRIDNSREAAYANKHDYINKVYSLPGGRISRFMPSVMLELLLEKALSPKAIGDMDTTDELFILDPCPSGEKPGPSLNRVRARTLKNKVTGAGFRKGNIYIRPGRGIDEWVSILELARGLKLISNTGAKWFVGKSKEDAFATYASKAEAVEALQINKDPEVLGKLRSLVYESVDDNLAMFAAEVSKEEIEFLDEGNASTSAFSIDDEDDGFI